MPIDFRCDCGVKLRVADRHAGKTVRCPSCRDQTLVPRLGEDPDSYAVEGTLPAAEDWYSAPTAPSLPAVQAASTFQSVRTAASPAAPSRAARQREASRRRESNASWIGSLAFPFRDENKYTFLGWCVGIAFVAMMMSVPMPFFIAAAMRMVVFLIAMGYFFHFLSEVVRTAAGGEEFLPETSSGEEVALDVVNWWAAVIFGLSPWWGFHLVNWWFQQGWPQSVGWGLLAFSVLYSPMALLATTLFNTVLAANPVYVVGAIAKMPLQYLATCGFMLGLLVGYVVVQLALLMAVGEELFLLWIPLNTISGVTFLYVAVVTMHRLGSVYYRHRQRIGWFRD